VSEELKGKIAVVTGASAGIGVATAKELADAGARLVLVARREDRLRELAQELGAGTEILPLDLGQPAAPQALLDFVTQRCGGADILVNNAGVLHIGTVDTFELDQLHNMIAVNFESIVHTSTLFGRAMKAAGKGHIINISSIGAHLNAVGSGSYSGLKKALEGFTDSLRIEFAGTGVRVGIVAPGTTSTEVFGNMEAQGLKAWDEYIPALDPSDIARAIRFMAVQPARANVARIHVYSAHEGF
jgi:serine 3-dehydrogenase (NADP+)